MQTESSLKPEDVPALQMGEQTAEPVVVIVSGNPGRRVKLSRFIGQWGCGMGDARREEKGEVQAKARLPFPRLMEHSCGPL